MITLEFCYHTITVGATGTVLHDYILLLSAVHCLARVLCTRALDFAANVVHLRQGLLVLVQIVLGTWSFFLLDLVFGVHKSHCRWRPLFTRLLESVVDITQAQDVHKRLAPWQASQRLCHRRGLMDTLTTSHQCSWYIADHPKDKIRGI